MATRNLYVVDAAAGGSGHGTLQINGTAPSVTTMATAWIYGTVHASNEFADMAYASAQPASSFTTTTGPSTGTGTTKCFATTTAESGTYAAGTWTIAQAVTMSTAGTSGSGGLRHRVWKGTVQAGAGATEVTTATLAASTYALATTTQQNESASWTAPAFALLNMFTFVAYGCEALSGAVSVTGSEVKLNQDGTHSLVTTTNWLPKSSYQLDSNAGNLGASGSGTVTYALSQPAGGVNGVDVWATNASNSPTVSVTDSAGNTYTQVTGSPQVTGGGQGIWRFVCMNIAAHAAGNVVTVTWTTGVSAFFDAAIWRIGPSAGIRTSAGNNQFGSTAVVPGLTLTGTVSGDLVIGFAWANAAAMIGTAGAFGGTQVTGIADDLIGGAGTDNWATKDALASGTSTACTMCVATDDYWVGIFTAFEPASGGSLVDDDPSPGVRLAFPASPAAWFAVTEDEVSIPGAPDEDTMAALFRWPTTVSLAVQTGMLCDELPSLLALDDVGGQNVLPVAFAAPITAAPSDDSAPPTSLLDEGVTLLFASLLTGASPSSPSDDELPEAPALDEGAASSSLALPAVPSFAPQASADELSVPGTPFDEGPSLPGLPVPPGPPMFAALADEIPATPALEDSSAPSAIPIPLVAPAMRGDEDPFVPSYPNEDGAPPLPGLPPPLVSPILATPPDDIPTASAFDDGFVYSAPVASVAPVQTRGDEDPFVPSYLDEDRPAAPALVLHTASVPFAAQDEFPLPPGLSDESAALLLATVSGFVAPFAIAADDFPGHVAIDESVFGPWPTPTAPAAWLLSVSEDFGIGLVPLGPFLSSQSISFLAQVRAEVLIAATVAATVSLVAAVRATVTLELEREMPYVGDLATITCTVQDANGNLQDPGLVTAAMRTPDGIVTTQTVARVSLGTYAFSYLWTQQNGYVVQFLGTSPYPFAKYEPFSVLQTPTGF